MRQFLIFLIATLVPIALAQGSDCPTFQCFNNSTCANSTANFSDQPTVNGQVLDVNKEVQRNGRHCACLPGWTGLRCNTKYETCGRGTQHSCYHGGSCIPGLQDVYGNGQLYCDCTNAIETINATLVTYVGKYCEIPSVADADTPETVACNADKSIFCVNGGSCKADYTSSPQRPCRCGSNYDGPHCEFATGTVPDCTLKCQNGGSCLLGIRTHTASGDAFLADFFSNSTNYQYCDCPAGFYGAACETKSTECGDYRCFNGGECLTALADGSTSKNCDCTAGKTADKSYAGRFCQYESDTFCDKNLTENGQLFCVNNGTCAGAGDISDNDCTCPTGFHGPICEYQDAEQNAGYESCNLLCSNGGQCRKGAKDLDFLDKFGASTIHFNISHNDDFEHCVCPAGFLGLTCQHAVEVCGDGQKACFLRSECVDEEGSNSTCACESGFTAFDRIAGLYCQHKATTMCTSNGNAENGTNMFAFCVNDGLCKGVATKENPGHPGCNCTGEWVGEHCEYLKNELIALGKSPPSGNKAEAVTSSSKTGSKSGVKGFGILLLVVCFTSLVV